MNTTELIELLDNSGLRTYTIFFHEPDYGTPCHWTVEANDGYDKSCSTYSIMSLHEALLKAVDELEIPYPE